MKVDCESEDNTKNKRLEAASNDVQGRKPKTLQAIINDSTITPDDQTSIRVLDAIQTSIKEKEHFWYYCDETIGFKTKNR